MICRNSISGTSISTLARFGHTSAQFPQTRLCTVNSFLSETSSFLRQSSSGDFSSFLFLPGYLVSGHSCKCISAPLRFPVETDIFGVSDAAPPHPVNTAYPVSLVTPPRRDLVLLFNFLFPFLPFLFVG